MSGNAPGFGSYEARRAAFLRLTDEAMPANKTALFEVLAAAGIQTVTVTFDGSGDEGQIGDMLAVTGQLTDAGACVTVPVPYTLVPFSVVDWKLMQTLSRPQGAGDVIEAMAYSLLQETHAGWELNDGAYGEFTFAVKEGTIKLEFNERRMTSDYHEHEF